MKTKMTTMIGLVALGMIGFTNINATAANYPMNLGVTVETEENLAIEAWMLDSNLWVEYTETKAKNLEREKVFEIEAWMTDEDFFKAAETYTAAGSDMEIEKYAVKQIESLGAKVETEKVLEIEAWMTDEDFFKAAETYTAAGSDKEIGKYANKQIALENEKESK